MPPRLTRPQLGRCGWLTAAAIWAGALLLGAWTGPAKAQSWPTQPVTVVMPCPAGSGTAAFARPLFAAKASENSSGARWSIAAAGN